MVLLWDGQQSLFTVWVQFPKSAPQGSTGGRRPGAPGSSVLLMSGAGARRRGFEEELKAMLGNQEKPGRFTQGIESVMKIKLCSET